MWEEATEKLIAAVAARSAELGPPAKGDETSPAAIVAETSDCLKNQRPRMKHAQYRKLGLPITSSHIESTIKQINRRMKGTEKRLIRLKRTFSQPVGSIGLQSFQWRLP